ncbi:MAG: helix-turn-helix domain-containing protein [Candidatus Fimivivens sp.]|nr:helix-turn-helix domain-containing protein [Candidatus Fimivivens sp.]
MLTDQLLKGSAEDSFFSLQPFWNLNIKQKSTVYDQYLKTCIQFIRANIGDTPIDCVPGIGLMTIIFSCDAQNPRAYCCGVLGERQLINSLIKDKVLICRLRPGEFSRIFNIDSKSLANKECRFDDLIRGNSPVEQIALTQSLEEQQAILLNFLRKQYDSTRCEHKIELSKYAVDLMLASKGTIRIKEISSMTGFSVRHLQNVISSNIGISPKQLCDNIRFQYALSLLNDKPNMSLSQISQELGYYDQTHFLKNFKINTGMKPSVFLNNYIIV